jgi:hypothetical protein
MDLKSTNLFDSGGVPNLDCMSFADLTTFAESTAKTHPEEARLDLAFLMYPEEEDSDRALDILQELHTYAVNASHAVRHRLKGEIDQALRFEARCEMIYRDLPPYARW